MCKNPGFEVTTVLFCLMAVITEKACRYEAVKNYLCSVALQHRPFADKNC
jgi:hypothetical protein